ATRPDLPGHGDLHRPRSDRRHPWGPRDRQPAGPADGADPPRPGVTPGAAATPCGTVLLLPRPAAKDDAAKYDDGGSPPEPPWMTLGALIRKQRELAEIPMRQVAAAVGISNPYLSQIERGLRAPSEAVLNAIAASLETTADALYREAGY